MTDRPRRDEAIDAGLRRLILLGLVFLGLSASAGGVAFIVDPSGKSLGIDTDLLAGSVFPDFMVPGLFLLIVLGIVPLVVAYGFQHRRLWARVAAPLVGVVLMAWIGIQVMIIGYHPDPPLQLAYAALGLTLVAVGSFHLRRRSQTATPGA